MDSTFNVLIVGAGEINFGSVEGPWNHASLSLRLERILGPRLRVVGLIDPDAARADVALTSKLASPAASSWKDCKALPSVAAAAGVLALGALPRLAIVGAPPGVRGSDEPGRDLELQLARAFPGCALFVEKPVSSGGAEGCWRVARELAARGTLVGVGYMLRYLKGGREAIAAEGLVVMGTNVRYVMAYEYARKPAWWDKTISGGAIVEQATHFCDLSRYFAGDVHLPSVVAHSVQHHEPPGHLSAKRFDEDPIPAENRLPRLTSATWKYTHGAVGTLTHVIALHGTTYDTELDVYADGYHFKLVDLYSAPTLSIRMPGADDPFETELATFIDVVDGRRPRDAIQSSYADAIGTYELTWAIRRASERAADEYGIAPGAAGDS
ncbi:putative oxidoreductase C terminal-domain-containing protein [Epithele typhae]|uniref:putative oxidoreductase C terminal-domain-containing protein n=1 Tax=Epithele typhae TaxID=378194 RepID=UPI002007B450|nr:putative oxidoreductase C terminal-domain-containing protein [Epithele typhae]KAH9942270.1 putative oxidoreductase C terminal-domain-containing protein [Epithele typhae]